MATLFVWHIAQKHNHKPLSSHTTMSKRTPRTHTSTYLSRHLAKVVDEGNGGLLLNRIFNLVNVLAQVKETTQCGWPIPIPYHSVWVAHSHTTPCGLPIPIPHYSMWRGSIPIPRHSGSVGWSIPIPHFTSSHKDAHI